MYINQLIVNMVCIFKLKTYKDDDWFWLKILFSMALTIKATYQKTVECISGLSMFGWNMILLITLIYNWNIIHDDKNVYFNHIYKYVQWEYLSYSLEGFRVWLSNIHTQRGYCQYKYLLTNKTVCFSLIFKVFHTGILDLIKNQRNKKSEIRM